MSPTSIGASLASTLHQTFPDSASGQTRLVGLAVEHDAGPVAAGARDDARDAAVVGLAADRHAVVTGQHHDAARVDRAPDHLELLGEISARQLHVAVDDEIPGHQNVAVEEPRDAAAGVDRADRGRAVVGLGVDADRVGAVRRDARSAGALAEDAREALGADAPAVDAVVARLGEDAGALTGVDGAQRSRSVVALGVDADRVGAVRRDARPARALAEDAREALGAGAVADHPVVERLAQDAGALTGVHGAQRGRPGVALGVHPDGARAVRRDAGAAGALTVDAAPARAGLPARDRGDLRLA